MNPAIGHPMRMISLLAALLPILPLPPATAADTYKEIPWEALVPKGWDPAKELKALDFSKLQDSDPKAMEALQKMKALFDSAPTEPALAGRTVRLPGFAIPLEKKGEKVSEFLLVPYFGACIHSPPPPANQIIHVVSAKPLSGIHSMDALWVSGTLSIARSDSPWGAAAYRLNAEVVKPYEEPKDKR